MIVYNYLLAILCFVFPFLIGASFYKKRPFSSSSWICGTMLIAYIILIGKGFNLKQSNLIIFIFILILLSIPNIFSTIINYDKWITNLNLKLYLSWLNVFLIFIVLLIFLEAILNVIRYPIIAGDALASWFLKAKAYFEWISFEKFPIVSYPSLGSAIWYYTMLFLSEEYFGRIFFIIIYTVFIYDFFKTINDEFVIEKKFHVLICISTISLYAFGMTEKFSERYTFLYAGYQDWLVALLISFSYYKLFIYFIKNLSNGRNELIVKSSILPLFMLGCSGLVKEEGIFFALICLFSYFSIAFFYAKNINPRTIIKCVTAIIFTVLILFTYKFLLMYNSLGISNEQGFTLNSVLNNSINRILDIGALVMIIESIYFTIIYNYETIIPTLAAFTFSIINKQYKPVIVTLIPVIISVIFLFVIYLSTSMPLKWHLDTSLSRLFYVPLNLCFFGSIFILSYNFSIIYLRSINGSKITK